MGDFWEYVSKSKCLLFSLPFWSNYKNVLVLVGKIWGFILPCSYWVSVFVVLGMVSIEDIVRIFGDCSLSCCSNPFVESHRAVIGFLIVQNRFMSLPGLFLKCLCWNFFWGCSKK